MAEQTTTTELNQIAKPVFYQFWQCCWKVSKIYKRTSSSRSIGNDGIIKIFIGIVIFLSLESHQERIVCIFT